MNRYCICLLITIIAVSTPLVAFVKNAPRLTALENNWSQGRVEIQNTDDNSGDIVVNGRSYHNSANVFNVDDVDSINFSIPEAIEGRTHRGWGNLYIKVYKNGVNEPIAQAEVQLNYRKTLVDSNNQNIELVPRGFGKNVTAHKIPRDNNKSTHVKIVVQENGTITMTQDN